MVTVVAVILQLEFRKSDSRWIFNKIFRELQSEKGKSECSPENEFLQNISDDLDHDIFTQ